MSSFRDEIQAHFDQPLPLRATGSLRALPTERLRGEVTTSRGEGDLLSDAAWEDALRELREPEEISEAEARRLIEGEPRGRGGRFYRFGGEE